MSDRGIKRKLQLFDDDTSDGAGAQRSISNTSTSAAELNAIFRQASKRPKNDNDRGVTPPHNIRPIAPAPRYEAVEEAIFGGKRKRKRKTKRKKRKKRKTRRKRRKRRTRRKR
tara:strand:+ start:876 stop:1214 length:339 start_codon:yes stop_codon:yes gene_type:complete